MPGSTTPDGIPYPLPGDEVAPLEEWFYELATAIQAVFSGQTWTLAGITDWPGMSSGSGAGVEHQIVVRNADGIFAVRPPTAASHATPRSYVDGEINSHTHAALDNGTHRLVLRQDGHVSHIADGDSVWRVSHNGRLAVGLVPWSQLENIPSSFPPASHSLNSHTGNLNQSNVTGTWSKAVSTNGSGRFGAAWDNNIPGTRRAVWMQDNGTLGHTASSRRYKQDIIAALLTREQLRAIPVVMFRYTSEIQKQITTPGYTAAREIGVIAEEIHDLGLTEFVAYSTIDGELVPEGVHYEMLSTAALMLAQMAHDRIDEQQDLIHANDAATKRQLSALSQRLDRIEKGVD